jgi:hypothetical protein
MQNDMPKMSIVIAHNPRRPFMNGARARLVVTPINNNPVSTL